MLKRDGYNQKSRGNNQPSKKTAHVVLVEEEKRLARLLKVLNEQNDLKVDISQVEGVAHASAPDSNGVDAVASHEISDQPDEQPKLEISQKLPLSSDYRDNSDLAAQLEQLSLDYSVYAVKKEADVSALQAKLDILEKENAELLHWKTTAYNYSSLLLSAVQKHFSASSASIPTDHSFVLNCCKLLCSHLQIPVDTAQTDFLQVSLSPPVPPAPVVSQASHTTSITVDNSESIPKSESYPFLLASRPIENQMHSLFQVFARKQKRLSLETSTPSSTISSAARITDTGVSTRDDVHMYSECDWISRRMFLLACLSLEIFDQK
jgi:hypothetical protein